jgi:hypothetical protein
MHNAFQNAYMIAGFVSFLMLRVWLMEKSLAGRIRQFS